MALFRLTDARVSEVIAAFTLDPATGKHSQAPDLVKCRAWVERLSYPQQLKVHAAVKARMEAQGRLIPRFTDPIAMALASGAQQWQWLHRARHLQVLSQRVAATLRKKGNLAIEMPPRMGKSTLCSVWTPAWHFTETAGRGRVMLLTYADNFAEDWGQAVRDLMLEFGETWHLKVDPENTAKKDWRLLLGGTMYCAGISGQVIGKGADLLVLDDLMKEQDAASPIIREQRWKLLEGTAQSRVEQGGSIIVIMQRFHEDDIIGRLEKQKAQGEGLGTTFEFLRVPALAEKDDILGREEGQGLWPERHPQTFWTNPENNSGRLETTSPYQWASIYQQRPSPEGGGLVLRSWFEDEQKRPRGWTPSTLPPKFERVVQTWDLPLKDKQTSNRAAGFVLGLADAVVYVLAGWIKHAGIVQVMQQFYAFQHAWPQAGYKLVEDTAAGPVFVQLMRRKVAGIVPVKVSTSKTARLQAAIPAMHSGNVLFPVLENGTRPRWAWDALEELFAFPKGTYDDAVDALTQGINWLDPLGYAAMTRRAQGVLDGLPGAPLPPETAFRQRFFEGLKQAAQENAFEVAPGVEEVIEAEWTAEEPYLPPWAE